MIHVQGLWYIRFKYVRSVVVVVETAGLVFVYTFPNAGGNARNFYHLTTCKNVGYTNRLWESKALNFKDAYFA